MGHKKQHFAEDEIPIFDEACIYKRGEYWQFRVWLSKENKYARKKPKYTQESTAIEKGKAAYLDEIAVSTFSSIRNIKALLLDEAAATVLLQPTTVSEAPSFKSLDGEDVLEQYEHHSQLLHIQKSLRDKR